MDINTFFMNNASAVMGLIGVIAGAILTSIPIIFLQLLQRHWSINDENRSWRRTRLQQRLSPIQDWLDKSLQFTEAFTRWFNSDDDGKQPSNFLNVAEDDLRQYFNEHLNEEAIVYSHAVSTGDEELINLIKAFRGIRTDFINSLSSNNNIAIEAHRIALDALASKTARRIEFLLEQSHPIGGPYHDKSVFRFFRRKLQFKQSSKKMEGIQ